MYSYDEYQNLKVKYGAFSSWAVWDLIDRSDPTIINKSISQLHSNFIFLGLNISDALENTSWINFHKGPSNVRKIKYSCTDNILWGSYITDLFKNIPEKDSSKLKQVITSELIENNKGNFDDEMRDIKIAKDSTFVVFGVRAAYYFNNYFKKNYLHRVIYHHHYSHYGLSDKVWVESLWKKLGINQDFDLTAKKYR